MEQVVAVLQLINRQYEDTLQIIQVLCVLMNENSYIDNIELLLTYREQHYRAPDYVEEWLGQYIEYDFFSMFRMSRDSFYVLLRDIACEEIHRVCWRK